MTRKKWEHLSDERRRTILRRVKERGGYKSELAVQTVVLDFLEVCEEEQEEHKAK